MEEQSTQRIKSDAAVVSNIPERGEEELTRHLLLDNEPAKHLHRAKADGGGRTFVLNGREYVEIRPLSQSSGEAQIYLVTREEQEYVLKLYYPNFSPAKGLLQVVWNMDFELIVKMFDFGQTVMDGIDRDYELMEYLDGPSLATYQLNEDVHQFERIALSAAAALAYCHNCNVIHKDIKPGNFIFREQDCRELVLTDFGISTLIADDEQMHKTTQARTPLYAAPEMYENVIDGVVELTNKVDYYSLGIMLLFVWLGHNPFTGNERSMMRMKGEGKLPDIEQLPERVRHIIRGLTVVNPDKRWGFHEVEQWYKGEDVEVDEASVYLRYKSFVVDSEKNVLASNAHELAMLLAERKSLGIKYLYGKMISSWLEECGNRKLAVELNDIVARRYPHNRDAGFCAALYTLDKSRPYCDVRGTECGNVSEIVLSLLANADEYKLLLRDEYNPLFIYLEITTELEVSRLREYFKTDRAEVALQRMIFEIDNTLPFLSGKPSSSIPEIIETFAAGDCSEEEWRSLTDGRLLSWMYYKCDPLLYVDIKKLYDEKLPYSRSRAYRVLYHLDPHVGFDLRQAKTREQVSLLMSEELVKMQFCSEPEFMRQMEEFIGQNSRLRYYAEMHGWRDVLILHNQVFDLASVENSDRYGSYDIRVASYRFCKGLGTTPSYYLRTGGDLISSLEEFRQLNVSVIRTEMKQGCMEQWLTIFFHEDPMRNFSEQYSYEHALKDYLLEVGRVMPDNSSYKRFRHAQEDSRKKLKEYRVLSFRMQAQEKTLKILFIVAAVCLSLFILVLGYSDPEEFIHRIYFSVGLPVGGVLMIVAATRSYFNGGGVAFNMLSAIVGLLSGLLPAWLLTLVGADHPMLLRLVSVGMIWCYVVGMCFIGRNRLSHTEQELKNIFKENINTSLIDPLYYTYKQKSFRFRGSNYRELEDTVGVLNALKVETTIHYVESILLLLLLFVLFVAFHASLMDMGSPDTDSFRQQVMELFYQFINLEE